MQNKKNKELITAYLDNELKSQEELNSYKMQINDDPSLQFDLKAESLTKELLKKKVTRKPTPNGIKNNILNKLSKENNSLVGNSSLVSKIYSKKFISYSTMGIILLAVLLLLLNRPDQTNINISEQTGNNNMLVLAGSYFENFINGNNKIQFISDNPEEIRNFFLSQGVKYITFIPSYENYSLTGASVTEHNGVKLAHHVYSSKSGKFIYIFQVHESYFKGDSIIRLSNDLQEFLKSGKCYKIKQKNYTTILKRRNENVLALVSNLPDSEIPENF